jgi:type III pantothenate kinase
MGMLLAIDVGNTNVTVGLFEGKELVATWRLATDARRMSDEYAALLLHLMAHRGLRPGDVQDAVFCSVVPDLDPVFDDVCRRYLGVVPLVVEAGVRTGLRILYDSPREVGADRVADAVAAIHLYGAPVIVVDMGTATVLDAVDRHGSYLGGAIAPGLGVAAEALFQRAAKLYRVELARPRSAIGRNTVAAMQSGIVLGYVGLVEGLVHRFKEELGDDAPVVATGGYAHLIASETKIIDHVNPDLTLIGLRIIHELNRG